MAFRADIQVNWSLSPRIITVDSPSTEVVMQDLHDTLRTLEAQLDALDDSSIISSAGKEELGGSVSVGITTTLQNAQLRFEPRLAHLEDGSVTTPDAAGRVLIDSTALFLSNGVARGDLIHNETDGSHSTVLSVDSEIQLTCYGLVGGVDDQFDSSDVYNISDVVQCNVSGGNLVAVDDVGDPLDPIFPSFGTQVVRTSSSSATLQELEAIQYASYQNAVWLDITGSNSGTEYPMGTHENPVNNLADAVTIANDRGFTTLQVLESMTLDGGTVLDDFTICGHSITGTLITIASAASCVDCIIKNCTIDGVLDGGTTLDHCIVLDLNYVNGLVHHALLQGTIVLGGSAMARILDSHSDVPGVTTPTIDCGGSGQKLSVRNYNGGIKLANKSGSESVSIDLNSGQIILDSTVTAGTIVCRGVGKLTDNSVGATVVNELLFVPYIASAVWDEELAAHQAADSTGATLDFLRGIEGGRWKLSNGQMIFYDDDNVTELARFDLKDKDGEPVDVTKAEILDRIRV